MTQPSLFISHGGPNIVTDESEARRFLESLPKLIERPSAIVVASAHYETRGTEVVADPKPGMLYDFGGFAEELYEMKYAAPGDPILAGRVATLLEENNLECRVINERGYDHGTWTPLILAFPEADIPVVQLSIDPSKDARYHHALGKALAPLRDDNVLLIGSGHITHNLRDVFSVMRSGVQPTPRMKEQVGAFLGWFVDRFAVGDHAALMDWENRAPFVSENHPTTEHLMPLFFAYGAGGSEAKATRIHDSRQFGFFAFDSWMFEARAA